jgi:protein-S-isoprenylcysteine O-methyltransferase Ste14
MSRIAILAAYALLGVVLAAVAVAVKLRGRTLLGRPPVQPLAYVLGKSSLIAAVLFLLVDSLGVDLEPFASPPVLRWTALGIFLAGVLLASAALATLGARTAMGVSACTDALQTGGIYRVSRNPMYLGLYLVCAGGCLFTLNPAAVILTLAGIAVHHRIILGEERFLKGRFGDDWDRYAARVRRYL